MRTRAGCTGPAGTRGDLFQTGTSLRNLAVQLQKPYQRETVCHVT